MKKLIIVALLLYIMTSHASESQNLSKYYNSLSAKQKKQMQAMELMIVTPILNY